jgi:hypothetical protein
VTGVWAVGMCVLDVVISSSSITWITLRHTRIRTLVDDHRAALSRNPAGSPRTDHTGCSFSSRALGTASPLKPDDQDPRGDANLIQEAPHADHSLTTPCAHMVCVEGTVLDSAAQVNSMIIDPAQDNRGHDHAVAS